MIPLTSRGLGCNRNATAVALGLLIHAGRRAPIGRVLVLIASFAACLVWTAPILSAQQEVAAQDAPDATTQQPLTPGRVARFLAGGMLGLAVHEGGHVAFGYLFDADPGVSRVSFSGIPFFAVSHDAGLSARRELIVSSAGFWTQQLGSELLLTRRPALRHEQAPLLKGMLAFNVLLSAGYAATAMARAGPPERDTRSMAASLGVHEAWVGGLVLAPAALDAWRYYHPHSRWAKWVSRGVKIGMVGVLVAGG